MGRSHRNARHVGHRGLDLSAGRLPEAARVDQVLREAEETRQARATPVRTYDPYVGYRYGIPTQRTESPPPRPAHLPGHVPNTMSARERRAKQSAAKSGAKKAGAKRN